MAIAKEDAKESKLKGKKFVILDIHGIMTDNTLFYTQEGIKSEAFSLHDKIGIKALMDEGIGGFFLTTKISRADEQMAKIYGGLLRKTSGVREQRWQESTSLNRKQVSRIEADLLCRRRDDRTLQS